MAPALNRFKPALGAILIPTLAVVVTMILFGIFVTLYHCDPVQTYALMYKGAFASSFSWGNTLERAAPLMLTALCTALPARIGLVIIGGEGAFVLGGLGAAAVGTWMTQEPLWLALVAMSLAGMVVGGVWIALAGVLRTYRGVNETISSLLLNYIAIALLNQIVEGVLRDPASLNKPSTIPLPDERMLPVMFGSEVHWSFGFGVIACVLCWILMNRSRFGFAASMLGGNARAAQLNGLSIGRLVLITCVVAGGAAGLAGAFEVSGEQGCASASLAAGYGYTGILVAFLARQQPLAIIPISVVLGGIVASGGLLQRREHLPDASVKVLEGMLFLSILASETLYGRWRWFDAPAPPATSPAPQPLMPLGEPPQAGASTAGAPGHAPEPTSAAAASAAAATDAKS